MSALGEGGGGRGFVIYFSNQLLGHVPFKGRVFGYIASSERACQTEYADHDR